MNKIEFLNDLIRSKSRKVSKTASSVSRKVIVQNEEYEYSLQNIVTSCPSIYDFIDLPKIHSALPNTTYNPKLFPGLSLRFYTPQVTISLFKSGKANCTGAKSFEEVRLAFTQLREIFDRLEIPYNPNFIDTVECFNMVTVFQLKRLINLEDLYIELPVDKVQYEPESFPGLVLKLNLRENQPITRDLLINESTEILPKQGNETITALIFFSGKVVVTGFKELSRLEEYIRILIQLINR